MIAPARSSMIAALDDLRVAHLLLLANHGELTNLAMAQVRDALNLDLGASDGATGFSDDRSRTGACAARFLQAQSHLRDALGKLGVSERTELRDLALPSVLLDRLGGIFDVIVLGQEALNIERNRDVASRVMSLYESIRASDSSLASIPPLSPFETTDEPGRMGGVIRTITGQDPRFWPTSRWILYGVGLVATLGLVLFLCLER